MIPNGTPYINYPPFANNGSKTPPGGSTESAKYALGMIPSDTFPAEWANYLFHGATEGITRLNADAGSIKKEINNVLSEAGLSPDAQVNTQLFAAIKALSNLTRTIISLSTSASERPAKSDVPFIPSVQDGLRISVKFTNGYYDAATNGFSFNLNNQGAKKIYAVKHGVLTEMKYHLLDRDGVQRKWYIQPLTTLDLIYDSTLDSGAGGWIVEGNPVVLSAPSYTVYASGQIGDEATGTVKPWPSNNIPYGWFACDHRDLQRTDYPELFKEIGTSYNLSTDSNDVFRLPDYTNLTMSERQASTTEQFTGRYRTGKPIYSKICLQSTTSGSISSNQWTQVDNKFNCPNNVETIINAREWLNTSFFSYWLFDVYQNTIRVYNYEDTIQMNNNLSLYLEYTKTTDTAGTVPPLNWIIKY